MAGCGNDLRATGTDSVLPAARAAALDVTPMSALSSADGAERGTPPDTQSVTYQVDPQHTGHVPNVLRPPLKKVWQVRVGCCVGYPVVADGLVVVAADGKLIALDAANGKRLWSKQGSGVGSGGGWVGAAYDNGLIFSDPRDTYGTSLVGLYALRARTGKVYWSASLSEGFFSSPPTAVDGTVYTGGSGYGGYVYAFGESIGVLKWSGFVMNGDESSPAVTRQGVYVSYVCPQTYDFDPHDGNQIWYYDGPCEGGGGSTPVLYDGYLFVGQSNVLPKYNGLIFKADTGKIVGGFNSDFTPAFAANRGFFVTGYGHRLDAVAIPSRHRLWTARLGVDEFYSPPLVAGDTVFIMTKSRRLLGYQTSSGERKVQMSLGQYGRYQALTNRGMGFGSNELVVPDGSEVIALKGS